MTAIHSVVESPLFEVGVDPRGDIEVQHSEYLKMHTAIERSVSFWSAREHVDRAPADTRAAAVGGWVAARSSGLMRRAATWPAGDAPADQGLLTPALVELRGPDELALAYRIFGEAFGLHVAEVAPRRTTIAAELLHLRTWALYRDAKVLACAMAVQVDDIVVVCAVATPPAWQGRGYGTCLMRMLHELYQRTGAVRRFVVGSSGEGCTLFIQLGYQAIRPTRPAGLVLR